MQMLSVLIALCPSISMLQDMALYKSTTSALDRTLFLFFVHELFSSSCRSLGGERIVGLLALALILATATWILAQLLLWLASPGGHAWSTSNIFRNHMRSPIIPGPRGLPFLGSLTWVCKPAQVAHRRLASWAATFKAERLMAFSVGSTRFVVASKPHVARALLTCPAFVDRPLNDSARQLLFARALGFSRCGPHWSHLRHLAASHLFAQYRATAQATSRRAEACNMLHKIATSADGSGKVRLRPILQQAALNTIMSPVFGRQIDAEGEEGRQLASMVREGFELLGAFNVADHVAVLQWLDPLSVRKRCAELVPRVNTFVQNIIDEHRRQQNTDRSSFLDVLLSLNDGERLSDSDIIAALWEMIFRATDTTALQCEWVLAELVLNPEVQAKLQREIEATVGSQDVEDKDIARIPYLLAVVKEAMRSHPVGPLLSWARLCVQDTEVEGYFVPAGTTAMVNMWAITHDPSIWEDPRKFRPDRHLASEGGEEIDIGGSDLRLAPFGAGRRACPGKALALATLHLWVARIVQNFTISPHPDHPVSLNELLKLSCEMATPLVAVLEARAA